MKDKLIDYIRKLYREKALIYRLLFPVNKLVMFISVKVLPEHVYRKITFKKVFNYRLNLDNPKTLKEKLNWIQLNGITPLHTLCSDRYTVRKYVKEKIGEKYLIPLVFHTKNPNNIVPDNLPDYPFIIKTNHGCGEHIIVRDKSQVGWVKLQKKLKKALRHNYYYKSKERQYKDIKPRIVVEKLLYTSDNKILPYDYKFLCYNGHVRMIEVITGRESEANLTVYDPNWKIIKFSGPLYKSGDGIEKPANFTKMKLLAETLAKDFKFVRVDLYNVNNNIYFSEMTFSPMAGFEELPTPKMIRELNIELKL